MVTRREKKKRANARRWVDEHESGFQMTSLKLPEGVKFFKVDKATVYRLEIIEFEAGAGNPYAHAGETHFERTLWTHPRIGVDSDTYTCPAKTAKKKCPICEHRQRLSRESDIDKETEKLIKDLLPKERQLWNVFDHAAPDDGVQIWDISFHLFGKQLRDYLKDADEEDGYDYFSSPDDGFTIKVGFTEEKFAGNTFYKTGSIEFKKRRGECDQEILTGGGHALDDLLIVESYDKLKSVFLQTGDDGDDGKSSSAAAEDEELLKKRRRRKSVEEKKEEKPPVDDRSFNRGDTVYTKKDERECMVSKISPDGALTLIADDDQVIKDVMPLEVRTADEQGKRDSATGRGESLPDDPDPVESQAAASEKGGEDDDWDNDWDED